MVTPLNVRTIGAHVGPAEPFEVVADRLGLVDPRRAEVEVELRRVGRWQGGPEVDRILLVREV